MSFAAGEKYSSCCLPSQSQTFSGRLQRLHHRKLMSLSLMLPPRHKCINAALKVERARDGLTLGKGHNACDIKSDQYAHLPAMSSAEPPIAVEFEAEPAALRRRNRRPQVVLGAIVEARERERRR
jgi:hypothetical protein